MYHFKLSQFSYLKQNPLRSQQSESIQTGRRNLVHWDTDIQQSLVHYKF